MENPATTASKIRSAAELEYATAMVQYDRIGSAVELCALMLDSAASIMPALRKGAEKGVVDALRQWCKRSGCIEQTTLDQLRRRVNREVAGL